MRYLLVLMVLLGGCGTTIQSFLDYAERRNLQSCVEIAGAMRAGSGIASGSVSVARLVTTGGADLDLCYELLR